MNILAVDTASVSVGVAVWQKDFLLGECFLNTKLTHSVTLMTMVDSLLAQSQLNKNELDALAVTVGPGSFTGLRIGLATIKGMALGLDIPCVGVSTLEALAYNLEGISTGYICPVMDARCAQVYTALFSVTEGKVKRVEEDQAISIVQLEEKLKTLSGMVYLVGDGTELCQKELEGKGISLMTAPSSLRYGKACSVARIAQRELEQGHSIEGSQLVPSYLRLPQAERELKQKTEQKIEQKETNK